MTASSPRVRLERSPDGLIWTITICRTKLRNAVCPQTASELAKAFHSFEEDPLSRVAVLTGAGDSFCAGADLLHASSFSSVVEAYPMIAGEYDHSQPGPMGPTRMELSKPVIAAIAGHAVAGGLELALWCDIRVADTTAVFGVFCRRFGVPLIDGGTVRLPRLIGESRAMDLILTGRPVDAVEAERIGLVNRIVDAGEALVAAQKLAREIASFPQVCMRADRASAKSSPWLSGSQSKALASELRNGQRALKEASIGAARFGAGAGRHGTFEYNHDASFGSHSMCGVRAVIFDLGGVVLDSPLIAIREMERSHGLRPSTFSRTIAAAGEDGAFARLERGLLSTEDFPAAFEADCVAAGLPGRISGREFIGRILQSCRPRPSMLDALRDLREMGFKTAALTNNFLSNDVSNEFSRALSSIHSLFDVVVESCKEGMRKPDPRIYQLACSRLGVEPPQCVFLDDIGQNLKPAARLGMRTIKVAQNDDEGRKALRELSAILDRPLRRALAGSSRL